MTKNANHEHRQRLSKADKLALWITDKIGTMTCAAVFSILTLISLPAALLSQNIIIIVGWITQTFLQLVLLAIILAGQKLQSRHSEHIADATYHQTVEIHDHLEEILTALKS